MADYTLSAKITGDASGFEKAFKTAEDTVSSFEKKMKNIGSGLTKLGSGLTNHITKPALLASAALGGLALGKGWNRMTQIDDARVKLEAIGNSAEEVEAIMDNALASVKGTAYGLDDAATTAAGAVAAGIPPGKELERYLTNVADAAAVAGADMSEMGAIFNKCATTGAVYNENLQQLADRGIPIYTWLAEEAGKSAAEIKKMASDGKISCEDLQKAIENHIGGAAKTIGSKTISGAISNIGAAISRIGANFLGSASDASSFAGQVLPILNDFTTFLGTIEDKAKEMGTVFGEVFNALVKYSKNGYVSMVGLSDKSKEIIGQIMPLISIIQSLANKFNELSAKGKLGFGGAVIAAGPLITILGRAFQGVSAFSTIIKKIGGTVGGLTTSFNPVIAVIMAVAGAFAYLMATNEDFRASVMTIFSEIGAAIGPILQQLMEVLQELIAIVMPFIDQLVASLAPILLQVCSFLSSLISGLLPPLIDIIASLMPIIDSLMRMIIGLIDPIMNILSVAISVIDDIMAALYPIIDWVAEIVESVVNIIYPIVEYVSNLIQRIMLTVTPIVDFILVIANGILQIIEGLFGGILVVVEAILTGVENAWNGLTGFSAGVFDGINSAFDSLVNTVKSLINGVINAINSAIGIINKIPGVSISKIPQLAHGTDDWQGGFAYMNEGGRGELTYLPNGAQVIPHDISVKYAKEAARAGSGAGDIDLSGFMEGMIISINNYTSVDGTELKETVSDYTIRKIGDQQKAVLIAKGAY